MLQSGLVNGLNAIAKKIGSLILCVIISLVLSAVVSYMSGEDSPFSSLGENKHENSMQSAIIKPSEIDVTLCDIGGLSKVKEELQFNLILPLQKPNLFYSGSKAFRPSKGFLLIGPPGTGKTMLAKAIAKESKACFIAPTLSALNNKYYGETEKLLAATWSLASKNAPSVIFLDEIDGMCSTRRAEDGCATGFKTELLRLIDGVSSKHEAVVVLAACNNPGCLDPALKRRLSTVITVNLPDKNERLHILRLCMKDEDNKLPESWLGDVTEGFSGSDLAELYRSASSSRLKRVYTQDPSKFGLAKLPPLTKMEWEAAVASALSTKIASTATHCNDDDKSALRDLLKSILKKEENSE